MKIAIISLLIITVYSCNNNEQIKIQESRFDLAEPDKTDRIKYEINSSIDKISKEIGKSEQIATCENGRKILQSDSTILIYLRQFFSDTTQTNIKSDKLKRSLKKGEIAILLADKIKSIPIAYVVGVQQCTPPFNFDVETYLDRIQNDMNNFELNYFKWVSEELNKSKSASKE